MENKFLEWQKKKYSMMQKILFLVCQSIFFLFLLPTGFWFLSKPIDKSMTLPAIAEVPFNFYIGVPLSVIGLYIGMWAVMTQLIIGKGTPVPTMPTQKLVIVPPYTYSRNPMGFGYGIMFFGLGIIFNSISYVLFSIIFFALLLCYYKFVEEKELVTRFGNEYLEYKNRTPFLIPSFRRKKSKN